MKWSILELLRNIYGVINRKCHIIEMIDKMNSTNSCYEQNG